MNDDDFSVEFTADFGDKRLLTRFQLIGQRFWEHSQCSLTAACRGWDEVMGVVRFFAHNQVTLAKVLFGHQAATLARVKEIKVVYAIQDTTELDYSNRKISGLGKLNSETRLGIFCHITLLVTPERVPLGIWRVNCWTRDTLDHSKNSTRKQQSLAEKESGRWLEGYLATCTLQSESGTRVISIADREADIYEIYLEAQQAAPAQSASWVIRARHDRAIVQLGSKRTCPLSLLLALAPAVGAGIIEVPVAPGRAARSAEVVLKVVSVTLRPPFRPEIKLPPVTVTVVMVHEYAPPSGEEPLHWVLLTSLPVADVRSAQHIVRIYSARWDIEIFFRTWKTGCRIEALQLSSRARLEPCLGIYAIVTWRLLYLSRLGRVAPDVSAEHMFSAWELKAVRALACGLKRSSKPDHTLAEVLRTIAMIGGFLGRTNDGVPGVETLWRGLTRVYDVARALAYINEGDAEQ